MSRNINILWEMHPRFELTSANPDSAFDGNFQNGQRGYFASSLDRSTSFRDGIEGRNFSSGKANSRGVSGESREETHSINS